jgi:hypothetical protein
MDVKRFKGQNNGRCAEGFSSNAKVGIGAVNPRIHFRNLSRAETAAKEVVLEALVFPRVP